MRELREADLMQLLAEDARHVGGSSSRPTCSVYFGALPDVLAAVHARLEPGGWFIFTVEELLPDHDGAVHGNGDWALQRQGRYAHSMAYVANVAEDPASPSGRWSARRCATRRMSRSPGSSPCWSARRHDG